MRFSLQREVFLKPLTQVVNVVERRQTLPVLANLLARVDGDQLSRAHGFAAFTAGILVCCHDLNAVAAGAGGAGSGRLSPESR